jgi:PPK2 family polyphosphate:nucleotide phosphotransferase
MEDIDKRLGFMKDLIDPMRVAPGTAVRLSRDHDPASTGGLKRRHADARLDEGLQLLDEYQDKLAAQNAVALLIVLQGLDASGKDGTIKHVMSGLNPQGVEVRSFKQPSTEELEHDFLWRCQAALPGRGRIGIFNRSHYEEVLVVRVHPDLLVAEGLPDASGKRDFWDQRYQDINRWEHYLARNGVHIVKIMLNLSRQEQAKRFLERIDHPEKNWKFSPSDVRERHHWAEYQRAFDAMLSATSTPWAPWYVVPADHKWFTRLATAAIVAAELRAINPGYPAADPAAAGEMAQARAELVTEVSPSAA